MISYHLYKSNGLGGPVDSSSPVATTSGLTATLSVDIPSDTTFQVRAFDTVSGFTETNGDARVRVIVDDSGNDITNLPHAPWGLSAVPWGNGAVRVSWMAGGSCSGFQVYAGSGTPSYATPLADLRFIDLVTPYSVVLSGLSGTVAVGVRAFDATGQEANTNTVSVAVVTSGPSPIPSLTATVGV